MIACEKRNRTLNPVVEGQDEHQRAEAFLPYPERHMPMCQALGLLAGRGLGSYLLASACAAFNRDVIEVVLSAYHQVLSNVAIYRSRTGMKRPAGLIDGPSRLLLPRAWFLELIDLSPCHLHHLPVCRQSMIT